jgi:hypothetical protein
MSAFGYQLSMNAIIWYVTPSFPQQQEMLMLEGHFIGQDASGRIHSRNYG